MNCKNCGAKLRENARVCPNCGAFVDDESGYTLLTSDDRIDDFYSNPQKKSKKGLIFFLVAVLVIALSSGGALYYLNNILPNQSKRPELTFSSGSGIINGDEKVIYVSVDGNTDIEYIHGVSLYDYEKTKGDDGKSITTDYEYTKNIDSTFRAIFFDVSDFNLDEDKQYTYTFEMSFSFIGDDKVYSYVQPVSFGGSINEDAADIIFDHSLLETKTENTDSEEKTKETTEKSDDIDYIFSGYWYSRPEADGDIKKIYAFKFNSDKTVKITTYQKVGDEEITSSTSDGTYVVENGYLTVSSSEFNGRCKINSGAKTLTQEKDSRDIGELTNTVHNSSVNADDIINGN